MPLDETRTWYRYHHLFGAFLRERFVKGATAGEIARLHLRAGVSMRARRCGRCCSRCASLANDRDRLCSYIDELLAAFPTNTPNPAPPIQHSRATIQQRIKPLTERELQVLRLSAQGHSNQQIADALSVSIGTVKKHLNNIFGKLDAESRTQAVARARDLGLL